MTTTFLTCEGPENEREMENANDDNATYSHQAGDVSAYHSACREEIHGGAAPGFPPNF